MTIRVEPIPAFNDNYIWAVCLDNSCVVVDPGDAEPVLSFLDANALFLAGIVITHHHADHTGGIRRLTRDQSIPVYGPAGGHIDGITHPLHEGNRIEPLPGLELTVIEVPGHTLDHIAYFAEEIDNTPRLFCGDTLFAAGCGRLFEGTAPVMYASLQKLAKLPGDTLVYCAHEYTLNNLRFALNAEPDNQDIIQRMRDETGKRARHLPTLPSTMHQELRTNPFLRCHSDNLKTTVRAHAALNTATDEQIFAALRTWKDTN